MSACEKNYNFLYLKYKKKYLKLKELLGGVKSKSERFSSLNAILTKRAKLLKLVSEDDTELYKISRILKKMLVGTPILNTDPNINKVVNLGSVGERNLGILGGLTLNPNLHQKVVKGMQELLHTMMNTCIEDTSVIPNLDYNRSVWS